MNNAYSSGRVYNRGDTNRTQKMKELLDRIYERDVNQLANNECDKVDRE